MIDIGSGGGMDCLLAAMQVGANGTVIGIDMNDAMLERSGGAARAAGLANVRFEKADITRLPLADDSVDVVISNGVINVPVEDLGKRVRKLPKEREVIAYCRGPYCLLSVDAVAMLRSKGYKARRLEDGFPEWKASGLPVEV